MKTVTEAVFQLFLADGRYVHLIVQVLCFGCCKELQRLAGVIKDKVFEILVMAEGHGGIVRVAECAASIRRMDGGCKLQSGGV